MPISVAFVMDPANDWLEPFVRAEDFSLDGRYECDIVLDYEAVSAREIVFILGYTRIISNESLSRNGLNLAVHESDLPLGRGFAPVQWQVLQGARRIPICLLEAADPVDSGDIFLRHHFDLDGLELYSEIREKQARATTGIIREFLALYPDLPRQAQTGEPTHFPRRRPSDSRLDPDRTLREQFDLLRICNNDAWPAFFEIGGRTYALRINALDRS